MKTPAGNANLFLLVAAQALFNTSSVLLITLSGLAGEFLAPDKSMATLAVAVMVASTAAVMIPASLLMQRMGRKTGFALGVCAGILGGLLSAYALWTHLFWVFVLGGACFGVYGAFAQYYRFAAADLAGPDMKAKAISWVLAGGVVAAVLGPNLARATQKSGNTPFLMSFLCLPVLGLAALAAVLLLRVPPSAPEEVHGATRPLNVILRQPAFLRAVICSSAAYAVMSLLMTATPLAMKQCHHPAGASATVIQWHVLGMFVPSFFTGGLIQRLGLRPVMLTGLALLGAAAATALAGVTYTHFLIGLILLGVGWNFLFTGGSTQLTGVYAPAEKAKTQAAHDFLMFAAITAASYSSGHLLHALGWRTVNLAALPLLALALGAVLFVKTEGRPLRAAG